MFELLVAYFYSNIHMLMSKALMLVNFPLQVPNNYETDLIYPIIEKASELANVSYHLADDRTKLYLKVCFLQHVERICTV